MTLAFVIPYRPSTDRLQNRPNSTQRSDHVFLQSALSDKPFDFTISDDSQNPAALVSLIQLRPCLCARRSVLAFAAGFSQVSCWPVGVCYFFVLFPVYSASRATFLPPPTPQGDRVSFFNLSGLPDNPERIS